MENYSKKLTILFLLNINLLACSMKRFKLPENRECRDFYVMKVKLEDKNNSEEPFFMEVVNGKDKEYNLVGYYTPRRCEINGLRERESFNYHRIRAMLTDGMEEFKIFGEFGSSKDAKKQLDKLIPTKFSESSSKEKLLEIFKYLQIKKMFILRNEDTNDNNRKFNRIEADQIKKAYPKMINHYRNKFSREEILPIVQDLHKQIDTEFEVVEKKERLYNICKKQNLIMEILRILNDQPVILRNRRRSCKF